MDNRVYELRKKQGLTLEQLSKKSGIGKSTINRFENGESKMLSIEKMTRLADALGVTIDELFKEKKTTHIAVKSSDYPDKAKEEYIEELEKVLSTIETYKVRYFYIFTMAKLGIKPNNVDGNM